MRNRRNWLVVALLSASVAGFSGCGGSGGPGVPSDFKPDGKTDSSLTSPGGSGPAPSAKKQATPGAMDFTSKPQ